MLRIQINLHSDTEDRRSILTDRSLIYYYYAVTIDVELVLLLRSVFQNTE